MEHISPFQVMYTLSVMSVRTQNFELGTACPSTLPHKIHEQL